MASAKAGPRQTTRKVRLTLTEGEADLLLGVLGQVGGHPARSPRKYARRIYKALTEAVGYGVEETDAFHLGLGHIEFFDYDNHPVITTGDRTKGVLAAPGFQLHADFDPKYADALEALRIHVAMQEAVEQTLAYLNSLGDDVADLSGVSE